eukprot:2835525-Rhodomonas_salina.2
MRLVMCDCLRAEHASLRRREGAKAVLFVTLFLMCLPARGGVWGTCDQMPTLASAAVHALPIMRLRGGKASALGQRLQML